MENLRKIIRQLSTRDFTQIKSALVKNDSKKFLHLLVSYRKNSTSDEDIMKSINCNKGSLYVLKSRLLDKIQELLLENKEIQEVNFLDSNISSLLQYTHEHPRETATAMLHQLEKTHTVNDTTQELINVYSALKKIYFHSDKYYHYSQLYNKQIAYTVALEKSEDLLFNFNKTLANYFFSRTDEDKELIRHFIKEIKNIYSLNQSHRFELIKNFILIQSQLFADIEQSGEEDLEDLIEKCEELAKNYPNDKQIKYYRLIIDFFWFEYYYKMNQLKKAEQYLKIINGHQRMWLLLNNYCLAFKFLFTKPELLNKLGKTEELKKASEDVYFDNYDFYTMVALKFRNAIIDIYSGNTQEAIDTLSDLTREISLLHFFHFEIEIKLTLAYLYVKQNKYEKADELIISLNRKINYGKKVNYPNALLFIKVLNLLISKGKNTLTKNKIQDVIQQFNFYNVAEKKILGFLQPEIDLLIIDSEVSV